MAGEHAGVHDDDPRAHLRPLGRDPHPDRPAPVVDDEGRVTDAELVEQRRWPPRRGGRRCTNRCRSACRSGRTRVGRGRCSDGRRRAAAASPCATETTRSARRGRARPARPSPSSIRASRRPSQSRYLRLPGEVREVGEPILGRAGRRDGHVSGSSLAEQLAEADQVAGIAPELEPALEQRPWRRHRALADLDEVGPARLERHVGARRLAGDRRGSSRCRRRDARVRRR